MPKKIKDDDLLVMMLSGKSQAAIAQELNTTKWTVSRRVHEPEFQEMLSQYRRRIVDGIITALIANSQKAVDVLVELLDSDIPKIRFNAAAKILDLTQNFTTERDLMTELEKIKEAQEQQTTT